MPKSFVFIVLVSCVLVENSSGQRVPKYHPASVIHVHEYALPSTYIEDTGIDAPELPETYNFESQFKFHATYIPADISRITNIWPSVGLDRAIETRVQKGLLYVKTDQDRVIEMRLVGHRRAKGDGCPTKLAVSTSQ